MVTSRFCYVDIFLQLMRTQCLAVLPQLHNMVINLYIWVFCTLVIMGYFMQSFGLAADYGCFQLAGIMGTVGLFEIFGNVTKNIMDFEGDRTISYYLTLPTKPWVVFGSFVSFYTLIGVFFSIVVFPFGKLILYNSFDLTQVSWIRTAVIVLLSNIFFGVFTLLVTTLVGSMARVRNVWSRFIFPLWILGGFQFSWQVAHDIAPLLSYAMLLNPIVFIMEGCRAALLGQAGSLPWGLCCVGLMAYIVIFWFLMLHKMKKMLDFV